MILTRVLCLLVAVSAVPVSRGYSAEKKTDDAAKELLGCWQSETSSHPGSIRFEPARCIIAPSKGQMIVGRVSYHSGKVVLTIMGRTFESTYQRKDKVLKVTTAIGGKQSTVVYRKLDTVPPELELKVLALGKPKDLPADRIKAVQDELAKRFKTDQAVRTNPAKFAEMQKIDADNTSYVTKLVMEVGWIDPGRFGKQAATAAFLIVQHSANIPLMMAALPHLEKEQKAKQLDPQEYAMLYDRLQLMLGEKQRYGTQIGGNDKGEMILLPLQDRAKVEQFRKEIGLFPLSEYLKGFEEDGRKVKFEE